jgi:hypothetical protein
LLRKDDLFTYTEIINKKDYPKFESMEGIKESIKDIIDLGDNYLIELKNPQVKLKTFLENGSEVHNVNISIASAVTAYARIYMSQFKNNHSLAFATNLYYSDTDSVYFDNPLPDSFIDSTILGKMKLEGIWDKALFLSPSEASICFNK